MPNIARTHGEVTRRLNEDGVECYADKMFFYGPRKEIKIVKNEPEWDNAESEDDIEKDPDYVP